MLQSSARASARVPSEYLFLLSFCCNIHPPPHAILIATLPANDAVVLCSQILFAAQTLAQYPSSKIARENLEVFADAWESQINDLSILVKEVNDVCQGRGEKVVYLSLPRPGVSSWLSFCLSKQNVHLFW